jgi:[acyl-carrier-protein] S-malonyltransferase
MARLAALFPGQGAQFVGMGQSVLTQFPAAQRLFDEAREVLGFDLAEVCAAGPAARLDQTDVSQPALYVCSLAAAEMWRATQPEAVSQVIATAGLSLGEYTALTFAGALSFADGLRVVQVRGRAMQSAADQHPSSMVSALMLNPEQVEQVVQQALPAGRLWIANYLCPGNTVLSGEKVACEAAAVLIEQAGGKPVPLAVAGAFHTPFMASACDPLRQALEAVPIQPPRIPVVSNVDAVPHHDPDEIRRLLVEQVVSPVKWEASVRWLLAQELTGCSEVGPGRVLKGLLKRIDRKLECSSIGEA